MISYNQRKLCPNASWNANAITFANVSLVGLEPFGIFISISNTIYVTATNRNIVVVWNSGNNIPIRNISGSFITPNGLFVTLAGDVYIDNGNNHQIYQWSDSGPMNITNMYINNSCYGVFMDINNALYCSMQHSHMVIKISFNDSSTNSTIVAGTGYMNSTADALAYPQGIFVDINLNLYVADCGNNRIQRFTCGQRSATTVAQSGIGGIPNLVCPTAIVLDADNYLYIVDNNNHRIIRSANNVLQCILGCFGNGSQPNQLTYPTSLSFDSFSNLFVVDKDNNRIQKFLFQSNSCRK